MGRRFETVRQLAFLGILGDLGSKGDTPDLLAEMIGLANTLAMQHSDGDFRLVFNTGAEAGQTVFHVHAHVLAGGLSEKSVSD